MWRVDGAKVITLTRGYLADDCQKSAEAIVPNTNSGRAKGWQRRKVGKFEG